MRANTLRQPAGPAPRTLPGGQRQSRAAEQPPAPKTSPGTPGTAGPGTAASPCAHRGWGGTLGEATKGHQSKEPGSGSRQGGRRGHEHWPRVSGSSRSRCLFASPAPRVIPVPGDVPKPPPKGSTSLPTPAASGAVWRGGMSRRPWGGATPSLGWWHAVPWVVACHPQNSVTLSPEQCQTGQAKLHSLAGRDAEMASGPKLGCRGGCGVPPAAVLVGRAQICVEPAATWHGVRGVGVQKPHTDICHPKGEPWRGEEGSGRKPRRWLGVAEFAGGRKRLLGESKSKPRKKRAKPAWQGGPVSTEDPPAGAPQDPYRDVAVVP